MSVETSGRVLEVEEVEREEGGTGEVEEVEEEEVTGGKVISL